MKYNSRPSGVNHGSASSPSPAKDGGAGSFQPYLLQTETSSFHPEKSAALRTKYRSRVSGSNAGCDSNCALATGGDVQRVTVAAMVDVAAADASSTNARDFMTRVCARLCALTSLSRTRS